MKQLVIPFNMLATKRYLNGYSERIKLGQYEVLMITKENQYEVNRCRALNVATNPVYEVECLDGAKIKFDTPFYNIEKQ